MKNRGDLQSYQNSPHIFHWAQAAPTRYIDSKPLALLNFVNFSVRETKITTDGKWVKLTLRHLSSFCSMSSSRWPKVLGEISDSRTASSQPSSGIHAKGFFCLLFSSAMLPWNRSEIKNNTYMYILKGKNREQTIIINVIVRGVVGQNSQKQKVVNLSHKRN